jgi:Leucine-rich repeat (LRR) protein
MEPIKISTNKSWGLTILLALMAPFCHLSAQEVEDGSRFVYEKDWTPWKKAIQFPDTVQKLWINTGDPFVFSKLSQFSNLKGLIITEHPLTHLRWVDMFPNLEVLEVTGNGLVSLEGIESLSKLREFSCASNFITDLGPLLQLDSLEVLSVYNNDIKDLNQLSKMKPLRSLDLSLNPIQNLDPIAGWESLESFSVYRCTQLTDIDPVYKWTNLKELNISFLNLPEFNLAYLRNHTNLVGLRIQGMVKTNSELRHLSGMKSLEQLTMGKNDSIVSIAELKTLVNLRYLDIHSNNISEIEVVRNMPRLVKVVMYRNKIKDISPLLACPEMRALFMHENPVKDYNPIYQMGYLQYLNLDKDDFGSTQRETIKKALPTVQVGYM